VGGAFAAFWLHLWRTGVGAAVDSTQSAKICLYLSFLAASLVVYFVSFRNWKLGQP
jgi:hypothetical protein